MKKAHKSRAYKERLKGHKDGLVKVYSPDGPDSRLLISASKDGCIRAWDLIERKITIKLLLSREFSEQNANSGNLDASDDDEEDLAVPELEPAGDAAALGEANTKVAIQD